MAERLSTVLAEQRGFPLEIKVQALGNIIKSTLNTILKIPIKFNNYIEEIQQQIIDLENRLTIINDHLNHLRTIEANHIQNGADTPRTLRGAIMGELRNLLGRRENGQDSTNEKYETRECWHCKIRLTFRGFSARNQNMDPEWLLKIWTHPLIQIYCCSCFERLRREEVSKKRIEESNKVKNNLIAEEKEAFVFIERKLNRHILITKELNISSRGFSHRRVFPREFTIKDKHVVGLKLSNSGLTSVPVEIQLFSKLELLDLSYNLLQKVPEWIASLPYLTTLNLTFNDCTEIPELVLNKKNLVILPQKARMRNPMIAVINEFKQKIAGNDIPVRH